MLLVLIVLFSFWGKNSKMASPKRNAMLIQKPVHLSAVLTLSSACLRFAARISTQKPTTKIKMKANQKYNSGFILLIINHYYSLF